MSRVYGVMLLAYPWNFRREYAREMMLVFASEARRIIATRSIAAFLLFGQHVVFDWVTTIVRETDMRKAIPLGAATVLLLAVDWFAFHDIREPHTFRDYLTLVASMLVFFRFGWELMDGGKVRVTAGSSR
jgi:hypothetical protein